MQARERLIVALDVKSIEEAEGLIGALSPAVDVFKIGIAPFTGYGLPILDKLEEAGKKVFLDLKFHDIPNTVSNAAYVAATKGVFMLNFHCLGGTKMMRRAREGAREGARSSGKEEPLLLGVTLLTSMDSQEMASLGFSGSVQSKVLSLAEKAKEAGMDGVVASAREAEAIRKRFGRDFVIVTPGVRPGWAEAGDQKRVVTPKEALEKGADYIVVGRPVIQAEDPARAAERIIEDMSS
ncbi:MAG: orotidine-5'-phosphate decarboxylase [Candidatus Omnitrophica bacterium]|nr:orotidine-5'-phosphate decarboxylase [Candidatus Omnitrophota bacterium]